MIDINILSNNYKRYHKDLIAADDKALTEKDINFLALSYTCPSVLGNDSTRDAYLNLFTRMAYLYNAIAVCDISYTYYDLFREENLRERYNSHINYIKYLEHNALIDIKNYNIKNSDLVSPFYRDFNNPKGPLSQLFYKRIANGLIEQKPSFIYSTYDRQWTPREVKERVEQTYIALVKIKHPNYKDYILLCDAVPSINVSFIDLGTKPLTVWKKRQESVKYIGLKPPTGGKGYKKIETINVEELVGHDAELTGRVKIPMVSLCTESPIIINQHINREVAKAVHSRPDIKEMASKFYTGRVNIMDGNYQFVITVLRKDNCAVVVTYSDNCFISRCDDFKKLKSDFSKMTVIDDELIKVLDDYTKYPRECIIHTGKISSYPVYTFPPNTPKEKYKEYVNFSAEDHFKRENLDKLKSDGGTLTFLSNEDSMTYNKVCFGEFHSCCITTPHIFKNELLNFYVKFGKFASFEKMLVPKKLNYKPRRFTSKHYNLKYSTIFTETTQDYEEKHIFRRKIYWKNLFALTKNAGEDDLYFEGEINTLVDRFIECATLYDFKGLLDLLHKMDLYIKKNVIPMAKQGLHLASARKVGKLYVILSSIFHMEEADTFWRSEFNEGILLTNFANCDINIQLLVLNSEK